MKIVQKIILIILILMSLSAGAVKIFQMPQEVQFFQDAGLGVGLLILLGVLQIIGGGLAVLQKFRMPGMIVVGAGFLLSSIVIFMTGNIAFGAFSLLPVLLAGFSVIGGRNA